MSGLPFDQLEVVLDKSLDDQGEDDHQQQHRFPFPTLSERMVLARGVANMPAVQVPAVQVPAGAINQSLLIQAKVEQHEDGFTQVRINGNVAQLSEVAEEYQRRISSVLGKDSVWRK